MKSFIMAKKKIYLIIFNIYDKKVYILLFFEGEKKFPESKKIKMRLSI